VDEWLTKKELADERKVSTKTVERWCRQGIGPKFFVVNGIVRFRRIDAQAWDEAQLVRSTAEADMRRLDGRHTKTVSPS
jgi:predicted site-specific integrase-resolvase